LAAAQSAKAEAQLAQAEEQLEAAQTALSRAGVAPGMSWAVAGGSANSGSSLVIPKDGSDPKALEECEEDLNVMARILDKSVSHRATKGHNAMGIVVHTGLFGETAGPRNLYIEGYGAVFFLDVNYPLVAPPAKKAEPESKEETSSEWEDTRRELYHPVDPWGQPYSIVPPPMMGGGSAEEYDADKVEELRKDLMAALKNAAHIRKLNSDEMVTVVVNGRSRGLESKVMPKRVGGTAGGGSFGYSSGGGGSSAGYTDRLAAIIRKAPQSRGSTMILRAKKSDLESAEKLTPEEFRKKVAVQVY
jgi:hypothetical protein